MAKHKFKPAVEIAIKYSNDIIKGNILSGHTTKLACKRFLKDLKDSEQDGFPYYLDEDIAQEVVDFAQDLFIPDINKKLELLPWMIFVYVNIWGWKYKADPDRRRFRTAFLLLGRKNSKTTSILFPFILYDFLSENSAESYMFSATEDQSQKSFEELSNIIKGSEELEDIINCYSGAITYNNSRISFFSSKTTALDGYRNSLSVIDEYWDYQNDKCITACRYGGRARKNSLVTIITTAGNDISTPCYAEYKKAKSILTNQLTDDSYFCCVWEYDEKDDWKDSKNFIKANPSLGPILKEDILMSDLNDALITPSHVPDFKAKTCSIFTNDVSSWIPTEKWQQQETEIDYSQFETIPCYGGLDLSSVNDITAYSLCWHLKGKYYFKHHFYIPEETLSDRYKKENVNFLEWVDNGIITLIPGSTIDFEYIYNDIIEDRERFNIKEIAYDRWQSNLLINKLNEQLPDITYIDYDQSLKKFSPPTKAYEKQVLDGNIVDPNPVMFWMLQNVRIKPTANNDYKPLKDSKSSTKRIDGVITSIMSYDRCSIEANQTPVKPVSFDQLLNSF